MSSSPETPETIDHFKVVERLGMGGMGVVYRAEDLLLHRPVALKVMRAEHVADPARRARFLREARTAASLVHPNVATVYEVGEVDGTIFIAMELVPGETLRTVLSVATRERVSVRRALHWSVGIARALARAHELGIVHRDLKPDNVMVLPDDEVKLLDFGIAKGLAGDSGEAAITVDRPRAESMTVEGVVLGTPAYMSPEQARGNRLDVRSDVFSFGAMLFEMLSGVCPFLRATPLDTLAAIVRDAPPRLDELAGTVPSDVRAILARCMEKTPERRFANGGELLEALQRAVLEETTDVPAFAPPRRSSAPRAVTEVATRTEVIAPGGAGDGRKRPVAPWVAAVSALGLAAAVAGVAMRSRGETRATTSDAGAAVVSAVGCTSNSACSREHDGGAWKCNSVRHECVEIGSKECVTLADDVALGAEDTVWIGGIYPADPTDSEFRALDLARRDFASALGSSVARHDALHARPIALVVCDENVDAVRSAKHLAEDVEVPAVIGFRWAKTAVETIPSVFLPNHVLSFISMSQSTELTKMPQASGEPRLIWRSTFSTEEAVRSIAAFVEDVLEPQARSTGLALRPLRVALVRVTSPRDKTNSIFRDLRFNGKSALENGENFRQYALAGDDGGVDTELVSALVDFRPHVIFVDGRSFVERVVRPLERAWRGEPRPTYVMASDWDESAAAFAGTDPARRRRFFGVTNVSSSMPNAELVLHYNLTYPREPIVRTGAPQPSYDAFYVIADSIAAIGDASVTGPALSLALARLRSPGTRVEVGPADIFDAFRTLRGGGNIDLDGALGSLDFDEATGEAPVDFAILCFGVDDRGRAFPSVESGLVYDAKAGALKGTFHCP